MQPALPQANPDRCDRDRGLRGHGIGFVQRTLSAGTGELGAHDFVHVAQAVAFVTERGVIPAHSEAPYARAMDTASM